MILKIFSVLNMLSEMIFYIIILLHYYFKTTLPYKWDFCGLQVTRSIKLLINNGSYFIVYAAFIYCFVQYSLKYLRDLTHSRFLLYVISISAATQVFWRLFLLTTYFFSGSFYPWFSAYVIVFLNFPSTLSVLTFTGNGLRFMFQGFVVFVKNSYFECFTRTHISSVYSAGTTPISLPDAGVFNSTEVLPIVNRYSEKSTEPSEYQLEIRPPGARIPDGERTQASSDSPVSFQYFSGIRILPPLDANGFQGTEDHLPLSRSSQHRELRQLTESVTPVQKQLTSRQQESMSSIFAMYYPYPSQQSHGTEEIPGVPKLSYIRKLGGRSKEYAGGLQNDSHYQETRQTLPEQKKEIRISQFKQPYLTAIKELDEGEKVSKRTVPTDGKIRSTRKEQKRIGVSESTGGIHRENENLPSRLDFTQNRLPYRTRSGLIYGPLKR